MPYQRTESALPYLYGEKQRRDENMRNLLNMFLMSKQAGEERGIGEQERILKEEEQARRFQRWDVEEELTKAQTEKLRQEPMAKEPSIPAEIQSALLVSQQTGEPIGNILNRWRGRAEEKLEEPGIKKSRQKWLESLDKTIDGVIKGVEGRPEYGMDEELSGQVANLHQIKTRVRAALAIGADQPLSDTMWRELGKISENLQQIQKEGYPIPEKKPLVKAKLPKIKRSELPHGTEIKWHPEYNIKMANVKGTWHWVVE